MHRTQGAQHGPITRLMSPGDLGQFLKPFVFLDIFSVPGQMMGTGFGLHPHSGIATVTVIFSGDARFDDGEGHSGTLSYGGVEWCRAGRGIWHGRELGPGSSDLIEGFQLWLALPPDLELSTPDNQYLEAGFMPTVGPATVILGEYHSVRSPVRAFDGVSYLLVTLKPGETWRYETPAEFEAGWFAVARGTIELDGQQRIMNGQMIVLDRASGAIEFGCIGEIDAVFVVASARPHLHELHLGSHSVHSSREALRAGENHIMQLRTRLIEREKDGRSGPTVPVLK